MEKKRLSAARRWASCLIGAAGLMTMSAQAAAPTAPTLCIDDANGCVPAGFYRWYPALDLTKIPFHVGAGAWGPQVAIQAPAAPRITSTSNAANLAELQAAMAVPGRRVTVTANILGNGGVVNVAAITDVEVIIPNGILISGVYFGSGLAGTAGTVWNRVRFTKAAGNTIGGQIHQLRMLGASISDLIIDGLQISGNSGDPAIYPGTNTGIITRVAIVNNRIQSSNAGFGYGATHLVVAGNSMRHDADNGNSGGDWGWRQGAGPYTDGPYVYFQNDTRANDFGHIRFHPTSISSGRPYYVWVSENVIVDRNAGRSIEVGDTATTYGYAKLDGVWIVDNRFYVGGGGISLLMQRVDFSPSANYVRVNNNVVYGADNGLNVGGTADGQMLGNTYNLSPGSDPAWGGAGNPTTIDWTP